MKIKNSYVIHDRFQGALEKLSSRPMPAKQCLELNMSIDELVAHQSVLQRTRRNIVMKYACKNEDGTAVVDNKNEIVFPSTEIEETCKKELNEILGETIEVPLTNRIIISSDEKWNPLELRLVEDLIEIKD